MIDFIKKGIDFIGMGNTLTISVFLLGLLFTYYFYYRTFYRLVYSSHKICSTCKELGDWVKGNHSYRTRILFYNNGRKTLTREEIKQLDIISSKGGIKSARVLENKSINLEVSDNKVNIDLENLDSNNFFIIEIDHSEYISVEGRISEIGKILHTEPRKWVILNIIIFILLINILFYSTYQFTEIKTLKTLIEKIPILLNFFGVFLIYGLIRYIHSLFFIPDRIPAKYLSSKSKINNEFSTEL